MRDPQHGPFEAQAQISAGSPDAPFNRSLCLMDHTQTAAKATVKSQLRSTFEKTGTNRQSALVRLIVGIPAVREPG